MATQAQIDANRRNALKSTGPRTPEGKAVVASNAVKHGLYSEEAVIPGESRALFAEFADEIRCDLEEKGYSIGNVMVVERIILLRWKIRRVSRLEALAMKTLCAQFDGDGDAAMLAGLTGDPSSATLAKLQQYEMRLSRELRSCMNEFRKEFQSRNIIDCHRSYADGFNRGVKAQAEELKVLPTIPHKSVPGDRYRPTDRPMVRDEEGCLLEDGFIEIGKQTQSAGANVTALDEIQPDAPPCPAADAGKSAEQSQFASPAAVTPVEDAGEASSVVSGADFDLAVDADREFENNAAWDDAPLTATLSPPRGGSKTTHAA